MSPFDAVEFADEIAAMWPIASERPPLIAAMHDEALREVNESFPHVLMHHCAAGVELAVTRPGKGVCNRFRFGAGHEDDAEVAIESLERGGATSIEVEIIP